MTLTTYTLSPTESLALCKSDKINNDLFLAVEIYNILVTLHVADIFGAFIVICVKGKYDLLEGFNKLDNLIKVSIF